jgi:hypothetical protein
MQLIAQVVVNPTTKQPQRPHVHKINFKKDRTIRKCKKYDSIYKPLSFAHIGMAAFPSGSSKYIFVEPMKKYITKHIFIKIHDQTY